MFKRRKPKYEPRVINPGDDGRSERSATSHIAKREETSLPSQEKPPITLGPEAKPKKTHKKSAPPPKPKPKAPEPPKTQDAEAKVSAPAEVKAPAPEPPKPSEQAPPKEPVMQIPEQKASPNQEAVKPGANMPVAGDPLTVVKPPEDPLEKVVPLPEKKEMHKDADKKHPETKHYSLSEIKLHQKRRRKLFIALLVLLLSGFGVLFGLVYGESLYRRFTQSPEDTFQSMLDNLRSTDTIGYSLKTTTVLGVSEFEVTSDVREMFAQSSTAKSVITSLDSGINVDAVTDHIILPTEYYGNFSELRLAEGGDTIDSALVSPLTNVWVEANAAGSAQSPANFLMPDARGINSPHFILSAGQLGEGADDLMAQQLQRDVYSVRDCEYVSADGRDVAECEIGLSESALRKYLSYVSGTVLNVGYTPIAEDLYPGTFTVYVDRETNLPLELSFTDGELTYEYTEFTFNTEFGEVVSPVGALSLSDYLETLQAFVDATGFTQ